MGGISFVETEAIGTKLLFSTLKPYYDTRPGWA